MKPIRQKLRIAVSESNVRKSAARVLSTKLVSTEIAFVQRELGTTTTEAELDAKVLAVRALPWSQIVEPE